MDLAWAGRRETGLAGWHENGTCLEDESPRERFLHQAPDLSVQSQRRKPRESGCFSRHCHAQRCDSVSNSGKKGAGLGGL